MSSVSKYKYFTLVLYPYENDRDRLTLEYIINVYPSKYVDHDKDEVKNHTHIVFQTPSPRTVESVKKELDVPYIEYVRTVKQMIKYLTHENEEGKHHYNLNELHGDLDISTPNDELYEIYLLLEFINSSTEHLYIASLNSFACANGLWSTYRRNCAILFKTMEEHNLFYERRTKNYDY